MAQNLLEPCGLNSFPAPQAILHNVSNGTLGNGRESYIAIFEAFSMMLSRLISALFWATLTFNGQAAASPAGTRPVIKPYNDAPLQDIVTWDEHSIFVRGERIMLYNGEFHPYRLPVTSLWLDVFQKLKAAGFSGVSFYTDWYLTSATSLLVRSDGC